MSFQSSKPLHFILLLCVCSFGALPGGSASLYGQGIEFFDGTWAEALEKARVEDKLIFVDAYASWCGPCKRMAADVFPDERVGSYYNAYFINMKYDMEKAESSEFRRTHRARAYPTLMYINADNEAVHTVVGGRQVQSFIEEGAKALVKMDDVEKLGERWANEEQTPKLALRYVRALVRQGENHARVANDYLREQADLTTPEHLDLLLVAATRADSRLFDLLVLNRPAVVARVGEDTFRETILRAVMETKNKALEYRDPALLETAVAKLASVDKDAAKNFELRGSFEYAAIGMDGKSFYKAGKKYFDKGAGGEEGAYQLIFDIVKGSSFLDNPKVVDLGRDAAVAAAELDPDDAYRKYYRLAEFLSANGRPDEGLTYARMAKTSLDHLPAGKRANIERSIDALINRL